MSLTKIQPSGLDQTKGYAVDSLTANTIISGGTDVSSVSSTANASLVLAQGAFGAANTNASNITTLQGVNDAQNTSITAVSSYSEAAYNEANTASTVADNAYLQSLAGIDSAQAAYTQANTASTNIVATNTYAVSGFAKANSADTLATSAYGRANGVNTLATAAYGAANNKLDLTSGGTVAGTTSFTGPVTFQETTDVLQTGTVSATTSYDTSLGNIFYHSTVAAAANWTANFTNVPTTDNRTFVATIVVTQGATGYIPNAVQIGGVSQTILWVGGPAPTAGANKTEIFAFSLIRTGAAWIVLGQSASYG